MDVNMENVTLPKLLLRNRLQCGNRIAMRHKKLGVWQQWTWAQVYEHAKYIGLGLKSLGLERGERVVIIGNNEPELFWTEYGTQGIGGVVVCLYVDSLPDEIVYHVNHCKAKFFFAEDQEQIDKVIGIKDRCPTLEKCIYWDPKGLWFYNEPYLSSLDKIEDLGKKYEIEHPGCFENSVNSGTAKDSAVFIYSSGSTGLPKGLVQSYRGLCEFSINGLQIYPLRKDYEYVSYTSPAWAEQLIGIPAGLYFPSITSFCEEPETVQRDIREIGPRMIFYTPRLWEDLGRQIRVKLSDASAWKQFICNKALKIGRAANRYRGVRMPFMWRTARLLADPVLKTIRDHIGLNNTTVCFTAGSLIAPDMIDFFRALGLPLVVMYGISEVGICTAARPEEAKSNTIGPPLPGMEIRVDEGELCFRSKGMPVGYWDGTDLSPLETKGGWLYSGDGGTIDEDGHVVFWDRVSELIPLRGGAKFSPQFCETRLRFSPYIKDAVVFGGEAREYVTCIIAIDYANTGKWAELHRVAYTSYAELSQLPAIIDLLKGQIKQVNEEVNPETAIKKFVSFYKEFEADESELTRNRKLKRGVISERYKNIIDAMYEEKDSINVEATITYEDGRVRTFPTKVLINTVY